MSVLSESRGLSEVSVLPESRGLSEVRVLSESRGPSEGSVLSENNVSVCANEPGLIPSAGAKVLEPFKLWSNSISAECAG